MGLNLRPYQADLVDRARDALRAHGSVVVQLPTGGGKTALATAITRSVVERDLAAYFICHRKELIEQTAATFSDAGVGFGIIAAGYRGNPFQRAQICSVDTLRYRLMTTPLPVPKLVVWDECHHSVSASWTTVRAYLRNALHVGLSATPERLDGRGLRQHFAAMVCGPSVAELMAQGYLAHYRAFAPWQPKLGGVGTLGGDYIKRETAAIMGRPTVIGDAVEHYRRVAPGKRALAFAVSIKNSEDLVRAFRTSGFRAAHVDGETPYAERAAALRAYRAGDLDVLSNVDLFGEGFDVPDAEVLIDEYPTLSLTRFLQRCGRVMRPAPGKPYAMILDHVGNLDRHGLPDEPREWSLDGREKKTRKARAVDDLAELGKSAVCPRCACCHLRAPACPACGFVYPPSGRSVEMVDGELREIGRVDPAELVSVEELIGLGRARGYRNPEQWARSYWAAKLAAEGVGS